MEAKAAAVIRAGLKDILKEIKDFKTKLKMEFITFKEEIKKELKDECEDFKAHRNNNRASYTNYKNHGD